MIALILTMIGYTPAAGQGPIEGLGSDCGRGQSEQIQTLCADAALSLQALHGGIGLLMTAGGAIPASPSTAGNRMQGSPRIVVDLGATWATFAHPDLSRSGMLEIEDTRSFLLGARLTTVAGLFDGFSPVPAVGGVFSLDAVGSLQWVRVPGSVASGGSKIGWGGGVRVGIFRESFSLPGVSLSGMFHRAGELRYGYVEGTGALVALEPSVTSIRLIAGKDLWPLGLSAGVGWDRYRGNGSIQARISPGTTVPEGEARSGPRELSMNRRYVFGGVNFTWLITQMAAEVTWAAEGSPLTELDGTGVFRPGGTELQGALTFRVIY